jgi:hypothetical protein
MPKPKPDTRPLGSPQSWAKTPGTYISAQVAISEADRLASEMEQVWGVGRLRMLVTPELREKFDRQRYLFNRAIWHGDLENVRTQSARMVAAWLALDKFAVGADEPFLSPEVWEVRLEDGSVAAIVRSPEEAHAVLADGRSLAVYTLDEIGRLLSHYPQIAKAKDVFPGATVEAVRKPSDPMDAFADTQAGLDDPLNDQIPFFGV